MKKLIFNTAKEAFRRGFKKYKKGKRKTERVPYDLVKADVKRKIRGTRFFVGAEAKARPGIGSKGLPRGGRPRIFGKAYASDKRGKSMQIPMMTKKQRAANQEAISQSVRKFMKDKIGRKKLGGSIKKVYSDFTARRRKKKDAGSDYGQFFRKQEALVNAPSKIKFGLSNEFMRTPKKIKKKMLGGLLTSGIKLGYKQYRKAGGRKILEIMKSGVRGSGKRSDARADVRFGIKLHGRNLTKRDKAKLRDYAP